MKKFKDLQGTGTTILLVSHDIGAILQFSSKVVFIVNGSIQFEGNPKIAIDQYKKVLLDDIKVESYNHKFDDRLLMLSNANWCKELELSKVYEVYGNGKVEIVDISVINKDGKITQKLFANEKSIFKMKIKFLEQVNEPIFTVTIRDLVGKEITGTNTAIEKISTGVFEKNQRITVSFTQNLNIASGKYLLTFACSGFVNDKFVVYERLYHILVLDIINVKNIVGYFDINSQIEIQEEVD